MAIDKTKILTDADIDSIMDDWFVRDGETFTHARKVGRLGWEATLEEGDAYSAYIVEAPTVDELIKRAYSLARDMVLVMDPPFPFRIKISAGIDSYTDGKLICVSTKVFDDPELTPGEKLDTFLGYAVHEGAHLLYTDEKILRADKHPVEHTLWNILEDERIEIEVGEHTPGLANFLEKVKYYVFDQFYLDYIVPREKEAKLTPFDRIINCFLHIIRYPKYLEEKEIIEFGHHLLEVKKVVLPYPKTSADALKTAKRVFEIIKEFYVEEEVEKEKLKRMSSDELSDDAEGVSIEGGGGGTGETSSPELTEEEMKEIRKKAMDSLERDARDTLSGLSKVASSPKSMDSHPYMDASDVSKEVTKDGGLLGEIIEGKVELGEGKDTFFTLAKDDESTYKESAERVRKYVPAIAKILKGHCKEYKLIHRGMRSGVLDTNKLAEAYQGVPTVYLREGEVRTDKVAVCVLLDESGSMYGSRISSARDAAVLINEAVGSIPGVELFIYGHSGDMKRSRSTEMYVYREKGYTPKFSLGSAQARCENRDGVAILETAKRVRKQTKNPVLFFIMSDGAPAAGGYGGYSAMEHVKECVGKVEKMNFNVIQVCINASYDPGKMFRHYVILEDMSTLAVELAKAIKKSTMTAAKTHVL